MGMFDSFFIRCPKCKNTLEFQSKSGRCCLDEYNKDNLPVDVAIGINEDVVRCQFCNSRIRLICKLPKKVEIMLINEGTRIKFDYNGNYNEKHPVSIKRQKELDEFFKKRRKQRCKKLDLY